MNNAELFNSAGSKLSEMDSYLARATERMAVQDYGSAQRNISAAHVLLGDAGKALGEVAKAVLGGGSRATGGPQSGGAPKTAGITFPFRMDDHDWQNQAELDDHIARVAERLKNLENWTAGIDVRGTGFPDWSPAETDKIMLNFDLRMQTSEGRAFYKISPAEQFGLQNRGWKLAQVAAKINEYNSGAPPEGYPWASA